jgi:hypothetical protein
MSADMVSKLQPDTGVKNPQEVRVQPKRTFASNMQFILIWCMLLSFILITQQWDRSAYRLGILTLIGFTLLQIAFGNIPPRFNFVKSILSVALAAVIIGSIVWLSINLVPSLIEIGR